MKKLSLVYQLILRLPFKLSNFLFIFRIIKLATWPAASQYHIHADTQVQDYTYGWLDASGPEFEYICGRPDYHDHFATETANFAHTDGSVTVKFSTTFDDVGTFFGLKDVIIAYCVDSDLNNECVLCLLT